MVRLPSCGFTSCPSHFLYLFGTFISLRASIRHHCVPLLPSLFLLTARFRADSFPARTASTDSDKNARHLIRIWLENKDQPLPAQLRTLYAKINAGQGKTWPLEAWDTNPYLPTESAEEEKKEGEGASYD